MSLVDGTIRAMRWVPPGTSGFAVGFAMFFVVRYVADKQTTQAGPFTFEPNNEPKSFEPRLANYIRAVEFLLGLATGSIVLLIGSSALHPNGKLPWVLASPLIVLAFCVVYGVLFMVLMIYNYEEFLHHNNYTRARYVRSQGLGFSALSCFCLGYLWLVVTVAIALAR
jgi:hypothetical protein